MSREDDERQMKVVADDYKIELFIFPDGMAVEMLVFDRSEHQHAIPVANQQAAAGESQPTAAPVMTAPPVLAPADPAAASTCPLCGSALVYPVDWNRSGETLWRVDLRCPNCEMIRHVNLSREGIEQFNRALYSGAQQIARLAEELARESFEEEGRKLVAALQADLILPMDF
jgi:hypothetical protein